ncbi:MAG: hypothetical protein AAF360_10830, partial [Pseudomonadota bacterium]
RFDLTLAIAGVLMLAFIAGWAAHWAWVRMAAGLSPRSDRADELAAELMVVEADRDARVAAAEAETSATRAAAEDAETQLRTQLTERGAELEAAMEGLRSARRELSDR